MKKNKKQIFSVGKQVINIFIGLLILSPIIYALNISLMKTADILSIPAKFFPRSLTIENYKLAINTTPLLRYMINSLLIATITSIVRIIIASLAAYGFSFFEFRLKKILFTLVLFTILMPGKVLVVSNYQTVSSLGLINTYLGIMVVFFVNALNIFMLRQAFMTFPKELKEASELDGLSNFGFYRKILLPLNIPVITTVFISSFIQMWNEYVWPLLVTNQENMRTVQLGVSMFTQADVGTNYGALMASSIVALLPVAILFTIFRRQIIGGTMAGSVKG